MYWIYLIIFTLIVVTPDLIRQGISFGESLILEEERAEEVLIFFLGASGFIIYLWKEKQLSFQLKEKSKIQKEVTLISKNLTDSYSYIGEINRKVDILKSIALGLTENPVMTAEKERETYRSILHAVYIFSKSERSSIDFINKKTWKIIKSIKTGKGVQCNIKDLDTFKEIKDFIETNKNFYIKSHKSINGIIACITIVKRNPQQKLEDPELIKALASQALFLFTVSKSA